MSQSAQTSVPKRVLMVEDEPALMTTLSFALQAGGYTIMESNTGFKALELCQSHVFDCIILDVGLPDISGFDLLIKLRQIHHAPILMLTARNEEADKIYGLERGADDYVTKPFSPREVVARVNSLIRARTQYASDNTIIDMPISHTPTQLLFNDKSQATFIIHQQQLKLTRYEYLLLQFLSDHPMQVFSRSDLMQAVWTHEVSGDRTVDSHIKSIRAKLREVEPNSEFIETHRGFGYRFNPQ